MATQFWLASSGGSVWAFGGAANAGGVPAGHAAHAGGVPAGEHVESPVVAIAPTTGGHGYWLVTADGRVFARGDAHHYGSSGGVLGTVVDMAATPDDHGYWVVTAGGRVYPFGDATRFGPSAAVPNLKGGVVRLVPTAAGDGYWLLTSQGQVLAVGAARQFASPGSVMGAMVDMAPTPDGGGYWALTAGGRVLALGDAEHFGDAPVRQGGDPAENIVPASGGTGYWVVDQNGTATALGQAQGAPPAQGLMFSPVTPGDKAVLFAFSQLGKPYIWGGIGPKGYDCSGLAYQSWFESTGRYIPRVSNNQYHAAGAAVPWLKLQAGDLIFWGKRHAHWKSVYHTAMYVGGSQIVESTANTVQLNSVYQWGEQDLMGHGVDPLS